jgi:F-type H+-transporting ATPase subunit b
MRKFLVPLVAVFALAVAAAPSCLAAPEGEAPETEQSPNPVNPDVVVAIATIAAFGLLFVILAKTAWKPILAGLKAREDGIRSQIESADKRNADAEAKLAEYQRQLATAIDEAKKIVDEGRRDAETLRSRIEAEAKAEAVRERERALRDIELARQGALKDIYDLVAVVSTDVAGRILEQRLDPAQHRRLVDEGVAQFERGRKAPGSGGRA